MADLPPLAWTVAGVRIVYSESADGDMRDPALRAAFLARVGGPAQCEVPRQVHGRTIAAAGWPTRIPGVHDDADGLYQNFQRGFAIGVFGADCPGLALITPDTLVLAHCGWRGTAAGIVDQACMCLSMVSRHADAHQALIGPGISRERYEVDAPVIEARSWPEGCLHPNRPGHALLDLPAAIAADCRRNRVGEIIHTGICTAGDPRLHSHRHHGKGIVQMLAAWRL
jgi:copper oxidase (laccase) domain-containing protein